jgi:hypothetical protein
MSTGRTTESPMANLAARTPRCRTDRPGWSFAIARTCCSAARAATSASASSTDDPGRTLLRRPRPPATPRRARVRRRSAGHATNASQSPHPRRCRSVLGLALGCEVRSELALWRCRWSCEALTVGLVLEVRVRSCGGGDLRLGAVRARAVWRKRSAEPKPLFGRCRDPRTVYARLSA